MATNNVSSNRICIAVDPGFHATKVVVNGICFKVPNAIVDITGQSKNYLALNNNKKASGYILSHYIPGKEYLIGELARTPTMERSASNLQSERHGMMGSVEGLHSIEFEVHLITCIALALVKYGKEAASKDLIPKIDITNPESYMQMQVTVRVVLPSHWVDSAWPEIQKFLVNKHTFSVETDEGAYSLQFVIQNSKAMVNTIMESNYSIQNNMCIDCSI